MSSTTEIPTPARKGRPLLKALLVATALLIVTTLLIIALLGPAIASILARSAIEDAVNPTINGSVRIEKVRLSWTGPQHIDGIEIIDEQGDALASFDTSAGAQLLALVAGNLDLGELKLTRTNADPLDVDTATRISQALASTAPPTGEPLRLPTSLRTDATIELGDLLIEGATLNDVRIGATLDDKRALTVTMSARASDTDSLRMELNAPTLIDDTGLVNLRASGLSATLNGNVPAQILASLLNAPVDQAGALSLDIALASKDGVLIPTGADAVRATGVLPAALLQNEGGARIDTPPAFTLTAQDLAIPLPASGFAIQPADIGATLTLDADPIAGSVDDGASGRLAFETRRIVADLTYDPGPGRAAVESGIDLLIDGRPSGRLELDALAENLREAGGAFRASGPERLTAEAALVGVPGALVSSFHAALADTTAVVGERIDASATVEITVEERTSNNAQVPAGQPTLRLLVEGQRGGIEAHAVYDGARGVRTIGEPGIIATTEAAGLLAARLLGDEAPLAWNADAGARLVINQAALALDDEGNLDTRALAGDASLTLTNLTATDTTGDTITLRKAELGARVTASGLDWSLDAQLDDATARGDGAIAGLFDGAPTPSGSLTIENLPTSLAGVFSTEAGRALDAAFGTRIGGTLTTSETDPGALTVALRGTRGALNGSARLAEGEFAVDPSAPLIYTSDAPSALVRAYLAEATDLPLALEAGSLRVRLQEATVALDADRSASPLAGLRARGDLRLTDARGDIDNRTLAIDTLDARLALDGTASIDTTLDLDARLGDDAITLAGPLRSENLFGADGGVELSGARVTADISGTVPPALSVAFLEETQGELVRDTIGNDPVGITLINEQEALRLTLSASTGFEATLPFEPTPDGLRLGASTLRTPLTQGLLARGLRGTPLESARLESRPVMVVNTDPILAPWRGGMPDFGALGPINARAVLEGDLRLSDVRSPLDDQLLDATLRGVLVAVDASLDTNGLRGRVMAGGELGAPGAGDPIAFDAEIPLPANTLASTVTLTGDSAALDRLLRSDRLFDDVIGGGFTLDAQASPEHRDALRVALDAPNLSIAGDLTTTPEGGLATRGTTRLAWTLPAQSAQRLLLGDREIAQGLAIDRPVRLGFTLDELVTGTPDRPLDPARFRLSALLETSTLVVVDPDGVRDDLGAYSGMLARNDDGAIEARLVGEREDGERTLEVFALVERFADESGTPTLGSVRARELDLIGALPTRLVDIAGGTDGLATALIGPTTNVRASVVDPERDAISAGFSGENAEGNANIILGEGLITIEPESSIVVTRISDEASRRLLGTALPMFTAFEKTVDDEPASVVTSGLRIPLDNDLTKLNGTLRVDPGSMSFGTRSFFGRVLSFAGGNADGKIGERLQPFDLRLDEGVIRYEEIVLPLGEFTVMVGGRVNLKSRRINTVVWVPFGALEPNIAGLASQVPGVGDATMVPLRVRGDLDGRPDVGLDEELFFEGLPGRFIEGLLRGVGGG